MQYRFAVTVSYINCGSGALYARVDTQQIPILLDLSVCELHFSYTFLMKHRFDSLSVL